jgi:hypothetical protein
MMMDEQTSHENEAYEAYIEDFLDRNLVFLIDKSKHNDALKAREFIKNILENLPPVFQSLIMDTNTKFVYCPDKYFKNNISKNTGASASGHEIFFKADSTAEEIRHEIGHVIDARALLDHPRIREHSFLRSHFTGDRYTVLSKKWKQATENEVNSAQPTGWHWSLSRRYGDRLYEGDDSTIEYLKGNPQDCSVEAFAEITRKYLSLYAQYHSEDRVNVVLSRTYPKLWAIYRDEVLPELEAANIERVRDYNNGYKGTTHLNGKLRFPIERECPNAWKLTAATAETFAPQPC